LAKESLSSPPIIQTPGSGKPKPTFFSSSKFNVSNEVKQIADPAKVAGGLKVPEDVTDIPKP
jgi:hypothetical protein